LTGLREQLICKAGMRESDDDEDTKTCLRAGTHRQAPRGMGPQGTGNQREPAPRSWRARPSPANGQPRGSWCVAVAIFLRIGASVA